jgi:hypothetical protein
MTFDQGWQQRIIDVERALDYHREVINTHSKMLDHCIEVNKAVGEVLETLRSAVLMMNGSRDA